MLAHEGGDPTPAAVWKAKDEKHLNSADFPIRDAARKAAEAAAVDWRALLEANGQDPNE